MESETIERVKKYIKFKWSNERSSNSIQNEVEVFLDNLCANKIITKMEYIKLKEYNEMQKSLINDKKTIENISENSTLKELHNMYNHIETEECRIEFLSNVLAIIKNKVL